MSDFIATLVGMIIAAIFGVWLGYSINGASKEMESVKHHAAEYYLDANNDRQWHWLDEPKKETK